MFAIIGIVVVFAAVFGGYLLERGNPYVLMQPAELLIVGGAAAGIILVANPPAVIRKMCHSVAVTFRAPRHTPESFLRHLVMLFEVFAYSQRAGMMNLEPDVEDPPKSRIFSKYPGFLQDEVARNFICDSLRMLVIGSTGANELDHLMALDIDVQQRGHREPVSALSAVADALPGLGILAAVLGVVITMQAINGSPETVGQKVAAALVGTFLGILLCYGVVGPVAARLDTLGEQQTQFLEVLRTAVVSYARGASPILAIEYARRSIPVEKRPSFVDMEYTIRHEAKIPVTPQEAEREKNAKPAA
ncbi:MAG TPA: flagellar motor stator protein MotA [Bryobacteraceae bacterium]|nr:flagellar motor stator protein MotA [Bryobacteraceae bacterium]